MGGKMSREWHRATTQGIRTWATVNTGKFYKAHCIMANGCIGQWHRHLIDTVIPLYSREIEPVTYDWETIANVARKLKEYYEQHNRESG